MYICELLIYENSSINGNSSSSQLLLYNFKSLLYSVSFGSLLMQPPMHIQIYVPSCGSANVILRYTGVLWSLYEWFISYIIKRGVRLVKD